MTIDPFTAAARAEAAERFPFSEGYEVGVYQRRGFVAGAAWARDRLAQQEPTDAEQAVRDLHERAWNGELDYCPRCLDYEGAIWPCATIQALDAACRAVGRDAR